MNYTTVLLVSVALGIDAFSVAISIGLLGVKIREILIVSGIVSIFHVFMPLIGLYLGTYLGNIAGPVANIVGAFVLLAIGLNTIWDNLQTLGIIKLSDLKKNNLSKGIINIKNPLSLVLMAGSVSLDALTVGFGLGALKVELLLTVVTMGIVAGLMTMGGLVFGKGLSKAIGEKAEIVGGFILVAIALKLLIW
ncbi:MAG: manganese efflux pump MntP family protein [Clostridia bacterium]|nr:manganese efflux pump MntP family protein [Clostridia bacterium]MDD4048261.1 manganese efflux pump MntP family protein [Clostridia bacterium]